MFSYYILFNRLISLSIVIRNYINGYYTTNISYYTLLLLLLHNIVLIFNIKSHLKIYSLLSYIYIFSILCTVWS